MRKIIFMVTACLWAGIVFSQIKQSEKVVTFAGKKYRLHKVELGQTLYAISKSYGVGISKILLKNVKKTTNLREGELLKIPYIEQRRVVQSLKYKHYIVQKGDTLWSLARKLKTTEQELIKLNAGVEVALVEGRRLIVPVMTENQASYDENYYYHIVKKKETLSKIARRYGLSVRELKKINKNIKPNAIHAGDEIRIPIANADTEIAKLRAINNRTVGQKEVFVEKDKSQKKYKPLTQIPTSWTNEPYEKMETITENYDENGNLIFSPHFAELYKMLVLLPLKNSPSRMQNYYKGMLLAMQENENMPVDIAVFDTERSSTKVMKVLQTQKNVDFIVGPYAEDIFKLAVPYANNETTLVSLLSKNDAVYKNPAILQLNTTEKTINKRIATYVVEKHLTDNIVLFNGNSFQKYSVLALPSNEQITKLTTQINAVKEGADDNKDYKEEFKPFLDRDKKNIVIVPISNYKLVSQVLNALNVYSKNNIEVVGYYKWKLFPNISPELLFNLKLTYFTPFHYVPTEQEAFVLGYKERFQSYPDDFSFMGYVTMQKLLQGIKNGGNNFYEKPSKDLIKHQNGGYENVDLKKVQFKKDYSIVAE